METPWAVTEDKVRAVVEQLVALCQPRKIILFGSFVREQMNRNSDLDVLVIVQDDVADARKESVRLRRALRSIAMPIDILVIQEHRLRELADVPGLVYREALINGHVAYESET